MQNNKMKKEYQMPRSKVMIMDLILLEDTSTIEVPGGGSGTPDDSRKFFRSWNDEGDDEEEF